MIPKSGYRFSEKIMLQQNSEAGMCGRYVIFSTPEAIRALFRYGEQPNFPPRYNIAPTQPIPIVRLVDGKQSFALMRWGLLPSWVEEPKTFPLLINARGESVLDKPALTPCGGGVV